MNNVNNQFSISINQLPAEVIDHVVSFGNRFSIDAMALTCKIWNEVISYSKTIDSKKLRAQYQDYIADYNFTPQTKNKSVSFSSRVGRIHSCGQLFFGLTNLSLNVIDLCTKQEVFKLIFKEGNELINTKVCKDCFITLRSAQQLQVYDIRKTKSLIPGQQPLFQTDKFVGGIFHILGETLVYSPEKGKLAFCELTEELKEKTVEISEFDTSIDTFQSKSNGPVIALWQNEQLKLFNSIGEISRLDKIRALEIHLPTVKDVSFINANCFCVTYTLDQKKIYKIYQFNKEQVDGKEVITGYSACFDVKAQRHDLVVIGENILAHYQQAQEENQRGYKLKAYVFDQNSFQELELIGLKEPITVLKANSFGLIAYHRNGNNIYLWSNKHNPSLNLTVLSLNNINTTSDLIGLEKRFKNFINQYAYVQLFDGARNDSHFLIYDLKKLKFVTECYSEYRYQIIEDKLLTLTTNGGKIRYKSIYEWSSEVLKRLNPKKYQSSKKDPVKFDKDCQKVDTFTKHLQLKIFPLSEEIIELNKTIQDLTEKNLAKFPKQDLNVPNRKNKKTRLSLSIKPQTFKTATADLFLKKK